MNTPISIITAYNLRYERGILLPVNREYEIPRLKEIAIEQKELFARLDELDSEIFEMAKPFIENK